jgi:hypothetical protein
MASYAITLNSEQLAGLLTDPAPPASGLLPFFPLGEGRRSRHPVRRSGLIAVGWRRRYVSAPNTS